MSSVTLKFWHGGAFKGDKDGGLLYVGGKGKTMNVDVDELCFFDLQSFAKSCGDYEKVEGIFFLIPGLPLVNGLRLLQCDAEVLELSSLAVKNRSVELYVCHDKDLPILVSTDPPIYPKHFQSLSQSKTKSPPKKLTPRREPTKPIQTPLRSSPRTKNLPTQQNHVEVVLPKVTSTSAISPQKYLPPQHFHKSETLKDHSSLTLKQLQPSSSKPTETKFCHVEDVDFSDSYFSVEDSDLSDASFKPKKGELEEVESGDGGDEDGYIVNARTKHLIYMKEDIRAALMQRIVKKRDELQKATTLICPKIQALLEREKCFAPDCEVLPSSNTLFNVSYHLDSLVVDVEAKTCTCKKWDMCGIPCRHAIACIFFMNMDAEQFVDNYFKRNVYLEAAYAGSIPPCTGERHWPKVPCHIIPPPIKIGPGRPRKNRIRDPQEDPKRPGVLKRTGMEMTCMLCNVKGHNKRGCPDKNTAVPPQPQPKKLRGRPRNDGQPPKNMASTYTAPSQTTTARQSHHTSTAQPSQLGRGGRMIRGGIGARGGSVGARGGAARAGEGYVGARGGSAGSGRGSAGSGRGSAARGRGRGTLPRGVGVLFSNDGSVLWPTVARGRGRGTSRSAHQQQPVGTQSSQTSNVHNPTQ